MKEEHGDDVFLHGCPVVCNAYYISISYNNSTLVLGALLLQQQNRYV